MCSFLSFPSDREDLGQKVQKDRIRAKEKREPGRETKK
jgi:hypothetical protein